MTVVLPDAFPLYLLLWFLGLMAHYLKKCTKEKIDLVHYWASHKNASAMSLVSGIAAVIGLVLTNETSWLAYFAAGYIADSVMNRVQK